MTYASVGRQHRLLAAGWQAFLGCLEVAEEQATRWATSRYMFRAWQRSAQNRSTREGLHLATIRRRVFHPKGCRSEQAWRRQYLLRRGLQAFAAPSLTALMHCRMHTMQACLHCWHTLAEQSRLAQAGRQHRFCKRCAVIDHVFKCTNHHLHCPHLQLMGHEEARES